MSMSTPHGGGNRRPSSIKPGGKPSGPSDVSDDNGTKDTKGPATDKGAAGKTATAKRATAKSGAAKSAATKSGPAKGGPAKGARPAGKGTQRRPVAPVKVAQSRNWLSIGMLVAVIAIAVGIIGFGGWQVYEHGRGWKDRAESIDGIKNYRESNPAVLKYEKHENGPIKYDMAPPVGGRHNDNWQRCLGDVYAAPIASEHAIHSMEHGAVWITYRPDLPKDQVDALAKRVKGKDFTLMSPFPGQDKPISLQTWGFQLKVDNASDKRIDEFITALREVSSPEQGATCSSGSYITETGTTPRDLPPVQQPQGQPGGMPIPQPGG